LPAFDPGLRRQCSNLLLSATFGASFCGQRQGQRVQRSRGSMTGFRRGLAVAFPPAFCLVLLTACGGSQDLTVPRPDTRTSIRLSAKESEQLRHGMRIYLESVEGIVEGARQNRMVEVARSAKRSGMGMLEDISFADALKLPSEFIIMSIDTHQKFDALSREAADSGTKTGTLEQLSAILVNCTACHATYRLAR
jgi:hypothetical protein